MQHTKDRATSCLQGNPSIFRHTMLTFCDFLCFGGEKVKGGRGKIGFSRCLTNSRLKNNRKQRREGTALQFLVLVLVLLCSCHSSAGTPR